MAESTQNRSCEICDEGRDLERRDAYSSDPWEVVECARCHFVFLRNPPPYEQLEDEFAWEKTSEVVSASRHNGTPAQASVARTVKRVRKKTLKRRKIPDLVVEHLPPGTTSIVDIGCAAGGLLVALCSELAAMDHHPVPIGIEISKELAREAEQNFSGLKGKCFHGDALSGLRHLPDRSAGVVVMSSYLEHECQPLAVLRETARVLAGKGVAVIKVPNFASWNRRFTGSRWCGFRYPDHVNYFTPASLEAICAKAGLRMIRSRWNDHLPTSDNMYAVAGPADRK